MNEIDNFREAVEKIHRNISQSEEIHHKKMFESGLTIDPLKAEIEESKERTLGISSEIEKTRKELTKSGRNLLQIQDTSSSIRSEIQYQSEQKRILKEDKIPGKKEEQ